MTRNTNERKGKGKGEVRWDFKESGGWINDDFTFTKDQINQLKQICHDNDFVVAVSRMAGEYLSREKPDAPKNARFNHGYREKWVKPTLADMKATLHNLDKIGDKVKKLDEISVCHPIWHAFEMASYKEDKTLYQSLVKLKLRFRIKRLADLKEELETTPRDHPCWQGIQDRWDKLHKTDFDDMNTRIIPGLIKISLKHLQFSYLPETTNNAANKRFLALRLGYVLKRFGFKPTQTKDGPLSQCLGIVLNAVGETNAKGEPISNPAQYITPEMVRELKISLV